MLLVNYKPLLSGHRLSGIAGSAWLAPLMSHDQLCLPGVFRRALLVPAPLDEVTHGHRDRALTPLQTIHIVFLQNRIGCLNDTRRINREITSNKRKKKKADWWCNAVRRCRPSWSWAQQKGSDCCAHAETPASSNCFFFLSNKVEQKQLRSCKLSNHSIIYGWCTWKPSNPIIVSYLIIVSL